MDSKQVDVITLMVDNEFGVLTRVTALIRREGWNIHSLAVAETEDTDISRLTVSLNLRHSMLDQVVDRLRRLSSVREVHVFSPGRQVAQELCLVRIQTDDQAALDALCGEYGARRLYEDEGGVLLSVNCAPQETAGFLQRCHALGLRDIARTGIIALDKAKPAHKPGEELA